MLLESSRKDRCRREERQQRCSAGRELLDIGFLTGQKLESRCEHFNGKRRGSFLLRGNLS